LGYAYFIPLFAAATLAYSIRNCETIMDPVVVPIDGILDLHTFAPKDLKGLMQDYIDACLESNIYDLRIVHGKGSGVMRTRVRSLLGKDVRVQLFEDAPADAGGWGATRVTLKRT
jgi:DNA-nicking Smr family endonuclease